MCLGVSFGSLPSPPRTFAEPEVKPEHTHTQAICITTPRFPFHVLTGFGAIYTTFAGSSQIKGTPVWNGSLGVLWPLLGWSWGSFGRPLGSLGTPLGYLGGPLGVLWGVLGLPSGALGCTLGVPWDLSGVLRASERQNGTTLEPKWTHWSQNEAKTE